jgi:hypothetical protein
MGWIAAGNIRSGSQITVRSKQKAIVQSVKVCIDRDSVFNVEVLGWHTYFVGLSGAWVHNTSRLLDDVEDSSEGIPVFIEPENTQRMHSVIVPSVNSPHQRAIEDTFRYSLDPELRRDELKTIRRERIPSNDAVVVARREETKRLLSDIALSGFVDFTRNNRRKIIALKNPKRGESATQITAEFIESEGRLVVFFDGYSSNVAETMKQATDLFAEVAAKISGASDYEALVRRGVDIRQFIRDAGKISHVEVIHSFLLHRHTMERFVLIDEGAEITKKIVLKSNGEVKVDPDTKKVLFNKGVYDGMTEELGYNAYPFGVHQSEALLKFFGFTHDIHQTTNVRFIDRLVSEGNGAYNLGDFRRWKYRVNATVGSSKPQLKVDAVAPAINLRDEYGEDLGVLAELQFRQKRRKNRKQ